MRNLNHSSLLALLAASVLNATNATSVLASDEQALSTSDSTVVVTLSTNGDLGTKEGDKMESLRENDCPEPPVIAETDSAKEVVLKKQAIAADTGDGSGSVILNGNIFSTYNTLSALPTKPDPEGEVEDLPDRSWTNIHAGEVHAFKMALYGWAIFNLLDWNDTVVDIYIFDEKGRELAAFDSTGCGAMLFLEGELVTIVIVNPLKDDNAYKLNIYQ